MNTPLPKNSSDSFFQFLKDELSKKDTANILREAGADFVGYYAVWTVDDTCEGKDTEKYFAINPYDQKIFALSFKNQPPTTGEPVTAEEQIHKIYISIKKYLEGYESISRYVRT